MGPPGRSAGRLSAPTAVTLFSGLGLAALGLQQAGYRVVGAAEYQADLAAAYAVNFGDHGHLIDLSRVDASWSRRWAGVDVLQASPPCVSFSIAKQGGRETAGDLRLAGAVCRALTVLRPAVFVLENVRAYVHSRSLARIRATLDTLGYTVHGAVLNAADWGVPQTRQRLILRAVRDGAVPVLTPTHAAAGGGRMPWVGWLAALDGRATGERDLLPALPPSALAPWQLARCPPLTAPTLVEGTEMRKLMWRPATQPMWTLTASAAYKGPPRAFLVDAAADVDPARESGHWLDGGRVVVLPPGALARLMSVPDAFILPAHRPLACRGLGNGVPPRWMAGLVAPWVRGLAGMDGGP